MQKRIGKKDAHKTDEYPGDIMAQELEEILSEIKNKTTIDFETSFNRAKSVSKWLNDPAKEEDARKIIIHFLDNWNKIDEKTRSMWIDLVEAAGFYPYLQKSGFKLDGTAENIRKEYHKSEYLEGKYFHIEQKNVNDLLKSERNIILSAPTSFGKSLLIEEIVASLKYNNIVVIQPTLALLDETRKNLLKYRSQYKIIIRTSQPYSKEKKNIFLFTAERVMEYKELPKIDLLVLDEFYKLSAKRDDERSDVLNNAFYKLIKNKDCKFYLLGPNIDSISNGFEEKYCAQFVKSEYTLVDSQVVNYYELFGKNFSTRGQGKVFKEKKLFELLGSTLKEEQTIIYCSSPDRARLMAKLFCNYLKENGTPATSDEPEIIEWIKKNIGEKWSLLESLKYEIGVHDGALPRNITSSIIHYFNRGKLKYLFCTTTIIEGVNTSAKNVVFFDPTKGLRKAIDYFDYCNIRGRAGRMMVHYTGKLYDFNKPIKKEQIEIDIPFFEQKPAVEEIIIQLNEEHINDKSSEAYERIKSLLAEEKDIIKENGISVKGQKEIIDYLDSNIESEETYALVHWTGIPTYNQLVFLINLCWDKFLKQGESRGNVSPRSLAKNIQQYATTGTISSIIESTYRYERKKRPEASEQELFDESVKRAFQLHRHWIHYKIPKWISVVNQIQKYICKKHNVGAGEYTYYSAQLENEFVRENLSILIDYGVPASAIRKLEKQVPHTILEDDLFNFIKHNNIQKSSELLPYELHKIEESLQYL
jgi:hypothetical protein